MTNLLWELFSHPHNIKSKMKKLFLLLASIIAICSCNKENSKIDPSLVNVEIELSCIDEEPAYVGKTKHTILCTGKIGGFTGEARMKIESGPLMTGTKTVSVAGENTSFSYTFHVWEADVYTNKPRTFDITVSGPQYQELFRSSVVVYL